MAEASVIVWKRGLESRAGAGAQHAQRLRYRRIMKQAMNSAVADPKQQSSD
jgi:hypothetical protein